MVVGPRRDRWSPSAPTTTIEATLPVPYTEPPAQERPSRRAARRARRETSPRFRRRTLWLGISAVFFGAVALISGSTLKISGPDHDVSTELTRAFELQSAGQLEQAAVLYHEAISKDPTSIVAHFNLGVIESTQGDLDAAALEYEQVIALDPSHVPARFNLAVVRTQEGNPEAAITLYRELLAIQPAHAQALLKLGVLLLQQGDVVEGSGLIDRAVALDPSLDD